MSVYMPTHLKMHTKKVCIFKCVLYMYISFSWHWNCSSKLVQVSKQEQHLHVRKPLDAILKANWYTHIQTMHINTYKSLFLLYSLDDTWQKHCENMQMSHH